MDMAGFRRFLLGDLSAIVAPFHEVAITSSDHTSEKLKCQPGRRSCTGALSEFINEAGPAAITEEIVESSQWATSRLSDFSKRFSIRVRHHGIVKQMFCSGGM
ncbi:MAG TPA: hypothetical protein VFK56_16575 [Mycobacterium sp.]|nr:hypothetical protein [Mycobacterium sp.]